MPKPMKPVVNFDPVELKFRITHQPDTTGYTIVIKNISGAIVWPATNIKPPNGCAPGVNLDVDLVKIDRTPTATIDMGQYNATITATNATDQSDPENITFDLNYNAAFDLEFSNVRRISSGIPDLINRISQLENKIATAASAAELTALKTAVQQTKNEIGVLRTELGNTAKKNDLAEMEARVKNALDGIKTGLQALQSRPPTNGGGQPPVPAPTAPPANPQPPTPTQPVHVIHEGGGNGFATLGLIILGLVLGIIALVGLFMVFGRGDSLFGQKTAGDPAKDALLAQMNAMKLQHEALLDETRLANAMRLHGAVPIVPIPVFMPTNSMVETNIVVISRTNLFFTTNTTTTITTNVTVVVPAPPQMSVQPTPPVVTQLPPPPAVWPGSTMGDVQPRVEYVPVPVQPPVTYVARTYGYPAPVYYPDVSIGVYGVYGYGGRYGYSHPVYHSGPSVSYHYGGGHGGGYGYGGHH